MSEHTNETTIVNLQETITRLIEDRDKMRELVAAFNDWGVWQFVDTQPRDMCGMPLDKQMEHLTAERMRQLWAARHPEFFRKGIECQQS